MSTVTEEMILAAVRAFNRIPGLFPAMKGALEAAEAVRVKAEPDWYWRQIDPDDAGDSINEALRFVGEGVVCHLGSSYVGPSFFAAMVPVLDLESDDTEEITADTEDECVRLVKERYAALKALAAIRKAGCEAVRVKTESNLQKVQIPTSTLPEGFIPWHGGECPVAGGTVVDHVLRCRYVVHESAAKSLRWDHLNEDDTRIITDIIAYRIHKPADFRLEAGRFYVTANGERVGPMRVNSFNKSLFEVSAHDPRLWKKNGEPRHGWAEILALSSNQENSDG
jgi:hypothetical protein